MDAIDCLLCRPHEADAVMGRVEVWSDDLWRLTTRSGGYVPGFSFLEPRRHIPYITDLSGAESLSFGEVIARTTAALKSATGSHLVYCYVFGGGVPHLHLHLAPHTPGDALNDQMLRGALEVEQLPSGITRLRSKDFEEMPPDPALHDRVREAMRSRSA